MKRHWKTLVILGVALLLGLTAAAVALAGTPPRQNDRQGPVCGALGDNPDALKAMRDLRDEHHRDMQAWFDQYGSDSSSPQAQKALRELRSEHWAEMKKLLDRFGIDVPRGMRPGGGAGPGGCLGTGGTGCGAGGAQTTPGGMMGGGGYGMMGGTY